MALKQLVDGECGGANPLMRLANRYATKDSDKSELWRSHRGDGGLVEEFLTETKFAAASAMPQTFRMDGLLQEMRHIEQGARPKVGPNVADLAREEHDWSGEFVEELRHNDQNVIDWSREYLDAHDRPDPVPNLWAEDYLREIPELEADPTTKDLLQSMQDPVFNESEFNTFVHNLQPDGNTCTQEEWTKQFLSSADEKWAEEFANISDADLEELSNTRTYKQDFWKNLEQQWDQEEWAQEFEHDPLGQYSFREDNPLKDVSNPLEAGKKKLQEGDVPSAVLLFESAVQQNPESFEAWYLLGTTQAENEQDNFAIAALKQAQKLDPNNLGVLLPLAVSLTNESYQAQACHVLQDWIAANPVYAHLATKRDEPKQSTTSFMSFELHNSTLQMFLGAARLNPTSGLDADVQIGLGVLFNLSGDYDKAVDCFRSALAARPTDAQLWNKLGASLANGNRSEEAVHAYHNALKHSPGFVRARYNLGISCINLRAYSEAAEHFLTSLNFQSAGRGPSGQQSQSVMSDNVWSSLRLTLSLMDRNDLFPLVEEKNLEELNKILKV